jgi:hypothetical protein
MSPGTCQERFASFGWPTAPLDRTRPTRRTATLIGMSLLLIWGPAGLVIVISLLTAYTSRADRDLDRGGTWRPMLSTRFRRHPRIMAVQVLCLAILVVGALAQSI